MLVYYAKLCYIFKIIYYENKKYVVEGLTSSHQGKSNFSLIDVLYSIHINKVLLKLLEETIAN